MSFLSELQDNLLRFGLQSAAEFVFSIGASSEFATGVPLTGKTYLLAIRFVLYFTWKIACGIYLNFPAAIDDGWALLKEICGR